MITLGAAKKLGRGLISTSCLQEPPERLFVPAFWAVYLRGGHSPNIGTLNYLYRGRGCLLLLEKEPCLLWFILY